MVVGGCRESLRPASWLTNGVSAALLLVSVAGAAGLGIIQRIRMGPRVPSALGTGRAAAALGDSGAFAMSVAPAGVRPALALADAESAAVAFAYWFAPTQKVFRPREIVERPSERRSVCGRSYYVRSVVAVPPVAYRIVVPPLELRAGSMARPPFGQGPACPRWRLVLDRLVTLRGVTSGRIVDTRTAYVARADVGCGGVPLLQIPRATQPPTLASWYGVADGTPNPEPLRGACLAVQPPSDTRCTELRVTEPVWFEEARLHVGAQRRVPSGGRP